MEIEFNIQIHPERHSDYDEGFVLGCLTDSGIDPKITVGEENGRYINLGFKAKEPKLLWEKIIEKLSHSESFTKTSIACCQGSNGWDNYLLLYHYDKSEKIDVLKNH